MSSTFCERFHVAASHPSLPGHFPGNPIVPGVLLLDRVAAAVEREWNLRVAGVPQLKFLRPLAPETDAELHIERDTGGIHFRVLAGAEIIASGTLEAVA